MWPPDRWRWRATAETRTCPGCPANWFSRRNETRNVPLRDTLPSRSLKDSFTWRRSGWKSPTWTRYCTPVSREVKKLLANNQSQETGIRISYQLDVEESFVRIYRFPPVRMEIKNVLLISADSRERFEKGIVYPFWLCPGGSRMRFPGRWLWCCVGRALSCSGGFSSRTTGPRRRWKRRKWRRLPVCLFTVWWK